MFEPWFDRIGSPAAWVPFPNRRYSTYFATLNITDDCNLACRYCYARAGENRNSMAIETGKKIYDLMMRFDNRRIRFLFHGGEPLMNFLKLLFLTLPDQIAARYSLGCDCRSCLASTLRPVGVSIFSASSFSSRCSASCRTARANP